VLILNYQSKRELKEKIGKRLRFQETSMFGAEYPATGTGVVVGSNRPSVTGRPGREFFAEIKLVDDKIVKVN